jgi:DNA-binding NarL/FixJ family response regulator
MKPDSAPQVLMIDDDEADAMLVRHMVGKIPDGGCHLHWAGSYEQGLKVLGEIDWDVCLVDYQLGSHTGVEVVQESRSRGVETPFLLLTGVGNRTIDLQAMRAGVVGYLEKSRLCPLELERAIRYAMGNRPAQPQSAGPVSSHIPPEAVEALTASFATKKHFVVISLVVDRESALRNNLSTSHIQRINTDLEALVRARISSDEALFRTSEGALLTISSTQDAREGRQFLALLLSEPLAVSGGDRSRTVSLLAIVRRNVFGSSAYLCPAALIADLDTFVAPGPRLPGPDFRNF